MEKRGKRSKPDILFLSHGGGPMPLLDDPDHREMVDRLREIAARLGKPSAILLISAHWEEDVPTLTAGEKPELIYDYYGFPPEAYAVEYPCPGSPTLARKAGDALRDAGLSSRLDDQRGFDHGLFVPLKIMYPQADIPCVQLSLVNSLDPALHLEIGRALRALEDESLLVIGSGFSFHNMRAFFAANAGDHDARNEAFQNWLVQTCTDPELSASEREQRLVQWTGAPHARFCHPREEHLLPLHVCYGMAGQPSESSVSATILGKRSGMFLWPGRASR